MLKNIKKYIVFIFLISFVSFDILANDNEVIIEKGQKWVLESRSNKLSSATSKVLYFFSTDAYNTYYARMFSDWNSFSVIDSRNLVRLNTGDQIEVIKPVHQAKVYEVKLLSGYEKNRKYFVIKDDLINDYILSKDKDEI
mgnify:FL=1|tara:strand:+ start:4432 stop:4851 length:420 start_codon:yes stop_codon:yes gene_type:complete